MEESELIDKYLQGKLTGDEFDFVENRIVNDKEFKRKMILRKAIVAGISEAYSEELKAKLVEFDRSLESKKSPLRFSWKVAAVLVGLLTVTTVLIMKLSLSNQSLEKYDLTEIGIPNMMGSDSELQLAEAMNNFKSENYQSALIKFQSILKSKPESDTLLYFIGVSAYRTSQFPTAINSFTMVINQRSPEYMDIAEYRLALAYLSNGGEREAKEILLAISKNHKHRYKSNALMLLNEQF